MQVTIQQSTIKAVAQAMAKKDISYYLNGVCIETNGRETDGMAAIKAQLTVKPKLMAA